MREGQAFEKLEDAFVAATKDASGFVEHMRQELRGVTQHQEDYIRGAFKSLSLNTALIDAIKEENRLLGQRPGLERLVIAGDLQAAKDLERLTQRLERLKTDQGIFTPDQIAQLERYDEIVANLGFATKDLKIAVTTSFADDFADAARIATGFIVRAIPS